MDGVFAKIAKAYLLKFGAGLFLTIALAAIGRWGFGSYQDFKISKVSDVSKQEGLIKNNDSSAATSSDSFLAQVAGVLRNFWGGSTASDFKEVAQVPLGDDFVPLINIPAPVRKIAVVLDDSPGSLPSVKVLKRSETLSTSVLAVYDKPKVNAPASVPPPRIIVTPAENDPVNNVPLASAISAPSPSSQTMDPTLIASTTSPVATNSPEIIPPQSPPAVLTNHIVISEVMAGVDGNADYEFVELYNPTEASVDLTGWSLKKKSSTGVEGSLAVASRLDGKSIVSHGFFLLVNDGGYKGSVAADATWAKSNTIAYTNNAVILYNNAGTKVDEISWTDLEKGASLERRAVAVGGCVSAQNAGEYLGNGCDTDAAGDFENRAAPGPQNSGDLPEPR